MEQEAIKETVVATIGYGLSDNDTAVEMQMKSDVSEIENYASQLVVTNQESYEAAASFGKEIKSKSATITEFFAPIKKAAHDTHAAICKREKDMLAPLVSAEKIVKKAMGNYILEQERKKREEEERLRKLAQEEAERKLREALALEANGNKLDAEQALKEADYMDNASNNIVVTAPKATAEGVSYTTSWEIEYIDDSKVPITFNGVCLRPVAEKQVLAAIKVAKGKISIPGVKFKEVKSISIRK